MPVRSLAEAEAHLRNHFENWAAAILDAIRESHEQFGQAKHALETWTQRGIVRDLAVARLIAYHERTPGLHWWRDINATWFGAHNDWIFKPKKLNDNLRACITDTQMAWDFDRNIPPPQDELFETVCATTLYLGYVPTENRPLNPPIYLVCPSECGQRVEWAVELHGPRGGGSGVVELPSRPVAPSPDDRRVRVRPNTPKRAQE